MGSDWWVACDRPELLEEAERTVRDAEMCLSRFLPDSALSRLNRERRSTNGLLVEVLQQALHLRVLTRGAFDPSLGARLIALGYDRSFEELDEVAPAAPGGAPRPNIQIDSHGVRLEGGGLVDLGGVAKGFTVDRVLRQLLRRGARSVLIDGGGDIRGAGGSWPIGVGDDLVVDSSAGAIATSSTLGRRWRDRAGSELHHLVDPRTDLPAQGPLDQVTVVAPTATRADALATALLIDGARLLPLLFASDASALVRSRDGGWWTTPGSPFVSAAPAA